MSAILGEEAKLVWHGQDVLMSDVLAALDRIRKSFARQEMALDELPHPRSCVLTLVAVAGSETDERLAERTCRLIGSEHPTESIVVREEEGKKGGKLEGWIKSDVMRPSFACARTCEILTLHIDRPESLHLAELIDPVLVSGVPTYVWWTSTPPFGRRGLDDALRIADAMIVDSARFEHPHNGFQGLAKLMQSAHHKLGIADLQWCRLRPWREMVAQFFAPIERRPMLNGISEIGIDYAGEGRGNRIGAALTVGWLASSLGWQLQRAVAGTGGVVAAWYGSSGRTVEINFRSVPKADLMQGEVSGVRIGGAAQGMTFRLEVLRNPERSQKPDPPDLVHDRRMPDTTHVLLTLIEIGEGETLRHIQQVETEDEARLLLDILSNGTYDPVFTRSLASASALIHKF